MPSIDDQPLAAPPRLAVRAIVALRKAMIKAADACVPAQLAMTERLTAPVGTHMFSELARLGVSDSEDFGPLSDIQMMIVCGEGRERSRADFERLFSRSGFRLERVVATPTFMSLVEGVAI